MPNRKKAKKRGIAINGKHKRLFYGIKEDVSQIKQQLLLFTVEQLSNEPK